MKKLLTFIFAIAFCQISFGQKTDTVLFNGVKKIIVKNNKTAAENYKLAGQIMLGLGYNIGSKDSEFFQLASEPVKVQAVGVAHSLSIYTVSKDNEILITGKSKDLATLQSMPWQDNKNMVEIVPYKKSRPLAKAIFYRLSDFAKGFNGQVTYSE